MQYFYVLRLTKWKQWTIIILFAAMSATFLWFKKDGVFSVFSKEEPAALARGNASEPDISLTFNISWGEEKVHDILKQLQKHHVQATFFISGEWAERHPDILEKISEDKHEIGMLGYRYQSYLDQEINQVRKDINDALEVFKKLGYDDMKLLRTPSGHFDEEVIEVAESLGLQVVHWNVNPNDWKNHGTQKIVDRVMKETDNGDIILLHASDSAKQTADALQTILPGLTNKGFRFVTVSELMNQAHAKAKLVE
ncbi:MAG TPA: polysaccharide deacetylase family sporulation protein PdaB [Bacillota bacterium]|nr:polysaccharide deacetylase family sporulation protein PdaB [Bacillota bacterium]